MAQPTVYHSHFSRRRWCHCPGRPHDYCRKNCSHRLRLSSRHTSFGAWHPPSAESLGDKWRRTAIDGRDDLGLRLSCRKPGDRCISTKDWPNRQSRNSAGRTKPSYSPSTTAVLPRQFHSFHNVLHSNSSHHPRFGDPFLDQFATSGQSVCC